MANYQHICGHVLPDWLTIEITSGADQKNVILKSKIHMIKEKKYDISFGGYADEEVLNDQDLFKFIREFYGLRLVTRLESE